MNYHAAATPIFCLLLLLLFRPHSPMAYVYAALFSGVSLSTLFKDWAEPEYRFRQLATQGGCLAIGGYLFGYWLVFLSGLINVDEKPADIERCFWAVLLCTMGVGLNIGADVQKTTTLSIQDGLITNGYFARTRNPNYLGEILIFFSFGILSRSFFSWLYLFICWIVIFGSGMMKKEISLMQKDGYKDYKNKSLLLLPRIYPDYWKNYKVYAGLLIFSSVVYFAGGLLYIFGIRSPRKTYELF